MQNMASVIHNHNTKLLKDPVVPTAKECSLIATSSKMLIKMFSISFTGR